VEVGPPPLTTVVVVDDDVEGAAVVVVVDDVVGTAVVEDAGGYASAEGSSDEAPAGITEERTHRAATDPVARAAAIELRRVVMIPHRERRVALP